MLAEWLMNRYGWHDVWYLGSNKPDRYRRWWQFFGPNTCYVGVWTGPDADLLCVCECATNEEATLCLSPSGWTIGHAAIRSLLKRFSLDASRRSESLNGSQHTESRNSKVCQDDWSCDG